MDKHIKRFDIDSHDVWLELGDIVPVRVTGPNDKSSRSKFDYKYDSRCAMCYLGHAHSYDYHKREIARV